MSRRPQPANDYQRQNRMQIKEQEMVNREMKRRDQQTKERDEKMKERLRGQYTRKGSLTATTRGTAAAPSRGANATQQQQQQQQHQHQRGGGARGYQMEETAIDAVPRTGEIQVFVRETEPAHARQYTIKEELSPSPPPHAFDHHEDEEVTPPIAPSNAVAMCGPPSGGSGAARKTSTVGRTVTKATPGKVPAYLEQRKAEIQHEKDLLNQALEEERRRKQHPPGCTPLSHDEKTEILKGLEAKKRELMSDINRLPMRFDTTSIRKRRDDLESQIRDVENKIGQYSRKVVYVPEIPV